MTFLQLVFEQNRKMRWCNVAATAIALLYVGCVRQADSGGSSLLVFDELTDCQRVDLLDSMVQASILSVPVVGVTRYYGESPHQDSCLDLNLFNQQFIGLIREIQFQAKYEMRSISYDHYLVCVDTASYPEDLGELRGRLGCGD